MKMVYSPERAPSFWRDKRVSIGAGSPQGGSQPGVSSDERGRRAPLVATQIAAGKEDRTNDKVTNN